MRIHTSRRKSPVVPIVSLIDILAILLIFFIVTTTFKKKKTLLPIDIPSTERLEAKSSTEERDTLTVTADGVFQLSTAPLADIPADILGDVLLGYKDKHPDGKLELRADEAIPLKTLVLIWDALTEAGFKIKDVPARIQTSEPSSSSE